MFVLRVVNYRAVLASCFDGTGVLLTFHLKFSFLEKFLKMVLLSDRKIHTFAVDIALYNEKAEQFQNLT